MASETHFGPQGNNASVELPPQYTTNRYGTNVDTWVKDASSAVGKDGTVLDAAFFNRIIGNMRNLVKDAIAAGATISLDESNMNAVREAVQYYAGQSDDARLLSSAGFISATQVNLTPSTARIIAYEPSSTSVGYATPYDIVNSVLSQGSGVTLTANALTGKIDISIGATFDFGAIPVSGGSIDGSDILAFKDISSTGDIHRSITFDNLSSAVVAKTFQPPISGTGFLERDTSGNLAWATPDNAFPSDSVGQLTNDGSGNKSWVEHLPILGGQLGGEMDMFVHPLGLGRLTLAQLSLYPASTNEGRVFYVTGMGSTSGAAAGPVFSNGVNWRKMTNEIVA